MILTTEVVETILTKPNEMDAGSRVERLSPHYERSVLPLHHPAIKLRAHTVVPFMKCQERKSDLPSLRANYCKCLYTYTIHYLLPRVVFFRPHHTWFHNRRRLREVAVGSSFTEGLFLKNTINLPIYIQWSRKKWIIPQKSSKSASAHCS
jgi:hypothetical protein